MPVPLATKMTMMVISVSVNSFLSRAEGLLLTISHGAKSENHIQVGDDTFADNISGEKADKATQEDA